MTDSNDMFGLGGVGLLVILFFLMSGGFGGFGGNNQYATSNEVQRGFDNQNSMANQREILTAVNNVGAQGIAATNQVYHDIVGYVGDKYSELDRDILTVGSGVQQAIANQNECCCATKLLLTEQNAATNANITAGINSLREKLDANKIESLQTELAAVRQQLALSNVVRYPTNACYAWQGSPIMGNPFPPFGAPIA